ncbi:hypothetical protein DA2_0610 [Desulfovibrio sp. A2]|nr:hypothetical protein DA2_0610 [Desulfovibrio sp. A2]
MKQKCYFLHFLPFSQKSIISQSNIPQQLYCFCCVTGQSRPVIAAGLTILNGIVKF